MKTMNAKQVILICLLIGLSVLAIDALDRRHEIRTQAEAKAKVQELIRLMEKEKNGQVSKAEFMQFMNAEFERVDSDRSGSLIPGQMSHPVIIPGQKNPAGAGK
jgi:hypothetical protein